MGQTEYAIADMSAVCKAATSIGPNTALDSLRAVLAYHLATEPRWSWDRIGDALGVSPCSARKLARGFARAHHRPDPGQSPAEFSAWRARVESRV